MFIAAYVWMTGFGDFSYYYVRKDFSLARFVQMMWRLNFLVILFAALFLIMTTCSITCVQCTHYSLLWCMVRLESSTDTMNAD